LFGRGLIIEDSFLKIPSSARSIIMVTHGIGPENSKSILYAAERAAYSTSGRVKTAQRIAFPGVSISGNDEGLKLSLSSGDHIIMPVLWSDLDSVSPQKFSTSFKERKWSRFLSPAGYVSKDIVFYWKSRERRKILQYNLRNLICRLTNQCPEANIIVMAHSLGTLLAVHALRNSEAIRNKKTILITLGSPMKMMSRLSKKISDPSRLAAEFRDKDTVQLWFNFWRDQDFIGRSLFNGDEANCAEEALASGGHTNYWADSSLWLRLISLLSYLDRISGPVDAKQVLISSKTATIEDT
jgi:hypothetical protein